MAEEEEKLVSPQTNNSQVPENDSPSPKDNTIEEVINQGVYGLTGVNEAVSKPNDESLISQEAQNIDPNEDNASEENNLPDTSNNINQLQNQTDSNSEGISANAGEDENDLNPQEENQGELESLTNQLGGLLNENQQKIKNEEEDECEEEEEEEEEADDQPDPTPSAPEISAETDKNEIDNNNESNPENAIENVLTNATDALLNQNEEIKNDSNKEETNELDNLSKNIGMSLLPDESKNDDADQDDKITNETPDNESNDINKKDENESENKDITEYNENKNENEEDKNNNENENQNKDENNNENENQNKDENNNENENQNNDENNNDDENNSTDGMMVQDEFKDSYTNWTDSNTPKVPGTASVSHLPPLETTPELDEMSKRMLERFEQKGKLPDPEHYAQVLQYIQRQKVNAVVSNDFVSAGHYQTISQKFMTAINSTHVNESHRRRIDLLEEKLEKTNSVLREFQHETDQLIKNERYRLTDKRSQLLNIQQETLNNFEDHWNDEDFLIKYARPSSNLLQTKKIERSFVLVKDFEGAENCRKKVAELEKKESQEAQKRARSEMEKQYKKLTTKQEAEIDAFDESARTQLELISKDRSSQYEKLVARQSKLQSELHELKNPGRQSWASASGPVQPQHSGLKGASLGTSLPSLASGKSSQLENLMTPRTIQRYALFKTTLKQPKLTVKPLGAINQKRKKHVQAPKF